MKNYNQDYHQLIENFEPLLEELNKLPNGYLYRYMIETVLKMTREPQNRGELKLINSTLKELRYAFLLYSRYRDMRKVSIFGSARTGPEDPDYMLAERVGKILADKGFGIITGASFGIMGAGNNGAGREASFGCNIRLPFEQEVNETLVNNPRLINFKYFFTRKVTFVKESHAVILFPGGFGTLDEGFETLTLVQTGKSDPKPIILMEHPEGTYWKTWKDFIYNELLEGKKISPDDVELFSFHSTPETAVQEIEQFYQVYHSSRYVNQHYVVYCTQPLNENFVNNLNDEFQDILEEGKFQQLNGPLNEEKDDEILLDMPRLVFRFNRTSYGRLRCLINKINKQV